MAAEPATEPHSQSKNRWAGLTRALLRQRWLDLLIVSALLALFVLVHRFVEIVEFGGDAVAKWHFVRQWWFDNDFSTAKLDHHTGRLGVNAPAWLAQALFGRDWRVYYVAPFVVTALQIPLSYAVAKRMVNRLAGIIAALVITYLETVHRSVSQLLPDGFAATYAIAATYALLRLTEAAERKQRAWLVSLSVIAFGGYLAKETFVFFYPGLVVALWLWRRNWRDVAWFLGMLLLGLLLETACYAIFTKYSSRYAAISGTHGTAGGEWTVVTFWGLFGRFTELSQSWKYLLSASLASAVWLLAWKRRNQAVGRAVALIGWSQVFFLVFTVRSVNPIQLWQDFRERYFDPFTPFGAVLSGALLAAGLSAAWGRLPGWAWLERYDPAKRPSSAAGWTLALLAVLAVLSYREQVAHPPRHAFEYGARIARLANRTYERNLPLIQRKRKTAKDLQVVYSVYMSDELLARDGKLPTYDEAKRFEAGVAYIVKDEKAYGPGTLTRLIEAGCAMQVSRSKQVAVMAPTKELPRRCDAELAQAQRSAR